ncbi:HAD family hydrolase [Streptococcus oralis]|uniref:HAD superfamily hydrolase n=1 Tax=Streptococcus oralis TaxID=1303 RepID=A0A139PFA0_STROR|nr:HAD family phosphatase [Streptococcus oralis]KXT87984.1 HAD superfamily hydrolase [Streptococcus oralis]
MDHGLLSIEEAIKLALEQLDASFSPTVAAIYRNWYQALAIKHKMQDFARSCKERGYQVYILSNTSEVYYTLEQEGYLPIREVLDGRVLSFEEKVMKPDQKLYQILLDRYQLSPKRAIFLDDISENLKAAEDLGFHTLQVSDEETAIKELGKYLERFGKF